MKNEIADRYWEVRFESRKRQLYYSGRMRFWACIDHCAQTAGLIASTGAFAALMQGHDAILRWATFALVVISALAICMRAGDRARKCLRLYMAFTELEGRVPPPQIGEQTAKGAAEAERTLRDLIAADAWEMPCYDAKCYNDACAALGAAPIGGKVLAMNWIERTFGLFLPIPYTPKPHSGGCEN